MQVSTLDDLTAFLCHWYDRPDFSLPTNAVPDGVPAPLRAAWLRIGRLCAGFDLWRRHGTPSPLACQDGLIAPGTPVVRDGIAQVVFENQGNWSMGYRQEDTADDPPMFSDFLEQEIGGTGFVAMGCTLSQLIITSALQETICFAMTDAKDRDACAAQCETTIWTGHYYNAVGLGADYEKPSHRIRMNADRTLLCLDWDDKFSGFLADAAKARALI